MPCAGTINMDALGGSKLAQSEATFRIDAAALSPVIVSDLFSTLHMYSLQSLANEHWDSI